jgi:hypothetical protein
MKTLVNTLLLAPLIAAAALTPVSAAPPVVTPAAPTVNAAAEHRLRGLFVARNEADTQHLFSGGSLICGPYLWKALSGTKELEGKGADFRFFSSRGPGGSIGTGASGRMFNTRDSIGAFRRALLDLHPADPKARLRKLRPAELQLFAAMLPFGLAEPMFAIETRGHIIVVRMNEQLRIAWIDDFQHLR